MIENATSGSQIITIKQGTGATINIANGQVKMIATDGAGSGGAVLDLLIDVSMAGDLFVANTLNVAGDTAAGDAAAIGYTAAEGLILTGKVLLVTLTIKKNDAMRWFFKFRNRYYRCRL